MTVDVGAVRVWNVEAIELMTEFIGRSRRWSVADPPDGEWLVDDDRSEDLCKTGRPAVQGRS